MSHLSGELLLLLAVQLPASACHPRLCLVLDAALLLVLLQQQSQTPDSIPQCTLLVCVRPIVLTHMWHSRQGKLDKATGWAYYWAGAACGIIQGLSHL